MDAGMLAHWLEANGQDYDASVPTQAEQRDTGRVDS